MASSSLSSSRKWSYDVFPSFSGEDVRIKFLSHFLEKLDQKLIIAFKDNDIERSQSIKLELVQAIRDSRISVVVFSNNYASSSWCLDELVEIVKCKEVLGQAVIPIFYGLDPSHVRKQTGDFGMVFEKSCMNRTEEVINQWRTTLTDVANMAGFHSADWNNEAKMIEKIADDVLGKLVIIPSKDFGEFVGMEDHMAKMKDLLRSESDEVRIVGIWGPSGIGKTTIARALFNQLSSFFQNPLFVDRVFFLKIRETFSKANPDDYNMKLALQNKVLSKILRKKDIHVDHLDSIGERLKNQKVLFCIDDLDDHIVLDALVGNSERFGKGSIIIAVTTDKRLLTAHGINHIFEVALPSSRQALEIFCRAAFDQDFPPEGLMNFACEVVGLAGRLPLGLKILGSSLRGLDKDDCLKMLPRFRRSLDGQIEKTLRMSYDGLGNKEEKAIFRYIACFFNEKQVEDIMLVLADSELNVDIGLKHLVDKSLISVTSDNNVRMHCFLQNMGREIVRGQSDGPGEREFLWDSKDISYVLEEITGTKKVLGISLDIRKIEELDVHESAFKGMGNLRFLEIMSEELVGRLHLPESFDYLPPKLKYLCWDYYPMRCMPSKFYPRNLVKLKMRNSKLKKLWEGVAFLSCLHEMDLSYSENLEEIPDFSKAVNLERLRLAGCSSLVELPSSIGHLQKLIELIMRSCTKIKTLPTDINLESLHTLNLNQCSRLRTFPKISTNVSQLFLGGTMIKEVPWWIEDFSKLETLYMTYCSKLEYVRLNFSKLNHLHCAVFRGCKALTGVDLRGYQSGVTMRASNAKNMQLYSANYFKLGQEALRHQQVLHFPGQEVPSYFTHRTTYGTSLNNIPLLYTPLLQTTFRFRVCALVSAYLGYERVAIKVNCRFKGLNKIFYSHGHRFIPFKMHQLVIFDYCIYDVPLAKLPYNIIDMENQLRADMQIHIISSSPHDSKVILRGWGVRVMEDYSDECGGSNDNDEGNEIHENEDYDELDIRVFKSENEHCSKCGWNEDNDGGSRIDQGEECEVINTNWDTTEVYFNNCSKLKGRGVRLLEDCSSVENRLGNRNTTPPLQRPSEIGSDNAHANIKTYVKRCFVDSNGRRKYKEE